MTARSRFLAGMMLGDVTGGTTIALLGRMALGFCLLARSGA